MTVEVRRTRFAPSPTGDLHFGGAWTALASWAWARHAGGRTVLRMEDIDTPRVVGGSAARILDDLEALGLDFDEGPRESGPHGPYTQSERVARYEAALDELAKLGLTYPCDCSRAEIARAASAPHAGEERVYPGTCRDRSPRRSFKRDPAVRLRLPAGATVSFVDGVVGPVSQALAAAAGDFVLRRGDGVFAYQLVVAVDDAAMHVTDVVRGVDLLASTPRQIFLMQTLGAQKVPRYAHVPMVTSNDGERLAKRAGAISVRSLRDRGIATGDVLGTLASGLGLVSGPPRAMSATEIAQALEPMSAWRRADDAWCVPEVWR